MLQYVWERVARSLRRSFFSSKMLFKGLDAMSDSWLGVQASLHSIPRVDTLSLVFL
jgi:hypothetical protein